MQVLVCIEPVVMGSQTGVAVSVYCLMQVGGKSRQSCHMFGGAKFIQVQSQTEATV